MAYNVLEYLIYTMQDLYVKKAHEDNYRCRSAYKLIELDDKFHFLQPGRVVIDCGASPGIHFFSSKWNLN